LTAVVSSDKFTVNKMPLNDRKRAFTKNMLLASMLVTCGLVISGVAATHLISARDRQEVAQATPPLQASPPIQSNAPAQSKPGGERPTTPAPEPARPDLQAQKEGATPVLPPAPAEKIGPPIKDK
jgi:hypothetical protein